MKFKAGNISGTVIGYDLKSTDIINLLKTQIKLRFKFLSLEDETIELGTIYLLDRILENGIQKVKASFDAYAPDKTTGTFSYKEIIKMLKQEMQNSKTIVVLDTDIFKRKKPLLDIIGDVKEDIVDGCVYIDYEDGMFTVMNKPINNLPNCLFYWEETGSTFIFTPEKPVLLYKQQKFDSIESIICK